jgi:hypothetical protein
VPAHKTGGLTKDGALGYGCSSHHHPPRSERTRHHRGRPGRVHAELPGMSQARTEVASRTLGRLAAELAEAASMLGGDGA